MSSGRRIGFGILVVGACLMAIVGGGGPSADAQGPRDGLPEVVLERDLPGSRALAALADRVPEVAARNGLTTAQMQRLIGSDDSVWMDRTGRLLYVEPPHPDVLDTTASADVAEVVFPDYPLSETFSLHSNPGSNRVIFLDFDGFDAANTAWTSGNTVTYAEGYDIDGSPSFSDQERAIIQNVWKRVAEDFAPFDVDVTTEDPGVDAIRRTDANDDTFGTRIVITPSEDIYPCSCGGVAYLAVFDQYGRRSDGIWRHDYYQPAWVFIAGSNPKSIAEVASHEAGHNLALRHDGTSTVGYYGGHGEWAPIMGVGYYETITQWSRGEYADANNTEDDLAVMAANGVALRTDDHGDGVDGATRLTSETVDLTGVIASALDVDAFSFTTTGGSLSLTGSSAVAGPNLDLELRLLDETGATIQVSSSNTTRPEQLSVNVSAGTYIVAVDGVGAGDPSTNGYSDYGSVGHYRLEGSLPPLGDGDGGGGGGGDSNNPPTAVARASATSGPAPLLVAFDGRDSSDPDGTSLSYQWTFGDGSTATGAQVEHAYTAAGVYTVTLTVSDGEAEANDTLAIEVTNAPTGNAPDAPTNVAASVSGGDVTITWADRSANEDGFVVVRLELSGGGSVKGSATVGQTGANAESITDRPGRGRFRYEVYATNGFGSSDPVRSNQVSLRGKTGRR